MSTLFSPRVWLAMPPPHSRPQRIKMPALLCLSLALVGALVLPASRAEAQTTAETVRKRGQLVVGFRESAFPFSGSGGDARPIGYSIEVCRLIADRLLPTVGLAPSAVRYVTVPVDQIERYMQSDTIDMLCSATSDTPERRKIMSFSAPIYIASLRVLVRKQDGIASLQALSGKSVVVVDKTTAEGTLTRLNASNKLGLTVSRAVSAEAALGQLEMGWVAGYARDDVLLMSQLASNKNANAYRKLDDTLATESIAVALKRDDQALVRLANAAIGEAHRSGQLGQIYERWFVKAAPPSNRALNIPMSTELAASLAKLK